MMVEKKDAYQNLSDLSFDAALLFVSVARRNIVCFLMLSERTLICFYASIVGFLLLVEVSCGVLGFVFH